MSCCGNKRQNLPFVSRPNSFSEGHSYEETAREKIQPDINFEYTGETALTVKGIITGRSYRFNYKGDVQSIDPRDASSMMAIPVLKQKKLI
jgi:hypothetical protein